MARKLGERTSSRQHWGRINSRCAALRRIRARRLIEKKGPYWFALNEHDSAQLVAALALTRDPNERLGHEDPDDWAHLSHD